MNQELQSQPSEQKPLYIAIMVRCWQDGQQFRFMVENVATRERRAFENYESVNSYLRRNNERESITTLI